MTTYRLGADGWVPHVTDPDKWKKFFAAQVAGRSTLKMSPVKDNVAQKEEPVVVKLVSEVQDTYNRAQAVIKHEQKIEKQRRAVQEYDLNIPARKQGTVEKTFQYRTNEQKNKKHMRTVQDNEIKIPARKKRTVESAFQYRIKHRGNPYKKMRSSWKQPKYNVW